MQQAAAEYPPSRRQAVLQRNTPHQQQRREVHRHGHDGAVLQHHTNSRRKRRCHGAFPFHLAVVLQDAVAIVDGGFRGDVVLVGHDEVIEGVRLIDGAAVPQAVGPVQHPGADSLRRNDVRQRVSGRTRCRSVPTAGVQHGGVKGVQVATVFDAGGKVPLPQQRGGQSQAQGQQHRADAAHQLHHDREPRRARVFCGAGQDRPSSAGPLTKRP